MKVLYLAHRVPYAPNRGDRIRAYHTLRFLKQQGHAVCLVALAHEPDEQDPANGLADLVDELHTIHVPRRANFARAAFRLLGRQTLTHMVLDSPELPPTLERVRREWRPDVVLALCSSMARFALQPALAGLPVVIDLLDVDSFKWQSLAEQTRGPMKWIYAREARLLRQFEATSCNAADAVVVISDKESRALRSVDDGLRADVVPGGVDVDRFRRPSPAGDGVIFTGVFDYRPNLDGALWLLRDVWPRVRAQVADARLSLVGSAPPAMLRRAAQSAGAVVTGTVPDMRPYLWEAAVTVAPLHTARGVQNKVLEGVAAGLPAVVTPAVYDGLPDAVRPACTVAAAAGAFADAIVGLLRRSAEERQRLVAAAPLDLLRWERCLEPFDTLLHQAAAHRTNR